MKFSFKEAEKKYKLNEERMRDDVLLTKEFYNLDFLQINGWFSTTSDRIVDEGLTKRECDVRDHIFYYTGRCPNALYK